MEDWWYSWNEMLELSTWKMLWWMRLSNSVVRGESRSPFLYLVRKIHYHEEFVNYEASVLRYPASHHGVGRSGSRDRAVTAFVQRLVSLDGPGRFSTARISWRG